MRSGTGELMPFLLLDQGDALGESSQPCQGCDYDGMGEDDHHPGKVLTCSNPDPNGCDSRLAWFCERCIQQNIHQDACCDCGSGQVLLASAASVKL